MPHVPIFASAEFRGKSEHGLYAVVIEELDGSVRTILDTLQELKLEEQTLVIFFSDNGPFLSYGNHAGSAAPLREGKLTSYEGGVRVPCLMRWPGKIPAGRMCDEPLMAFDLWPTLAKWLGAGPPPQPIDGRDASELILGKSGARSPHEALVFYAGTELQAVHSGDWKLHFPHKYLTPYETPGRDGKPANWGKTKSAPITQSGIEGIASRHGYRVAQQPLALYNLRTDVGESKNVAAEYPQIVKRLKKLAEPIRAELGDTLTGVKSTAVRPAGKAERL